MQASPGRKQHSISKNNHSKTEGMTQVIECLFCKFKPQYRQNQKHPQNRGWLDFIRTMVLSYFHLDGHASLGGVLVYPGDEYVKLKKAYSILSCNLQLKT